MLAQPVEPLHECQARIVECLERAEVFLNLLQDAGDADLDELVQVAGRDGEELHALKQRVRDIVSLFEYPAVELKPASRRGSGSGSPALAQGLAPAFFAQPAVVEPLSLPPPYLQG